MVDDWYPSRQMIRGKGGESAPVVCSTVVGSTTTLPKKLHSILLDRCWAQSTATTPKGSEPTDWTRSWI